MINDLKIGAAVQYHDGVGGIHAAQVITVWSFDCVSLVYYDQHGEAWRQRGSVSRLMVGSQGSGFATLDQEGIAK